MEHHNLIDSCLITFNQTKVQILDYRYITGKETVLAVIFSLPPK